VSPESLAVGVDPDAPLVVRFSEKIDTQSLERALWVTPGGAAKPRFSGSTEVEIRFAHPFPESSTVGVLITTALRDKPLAGSQNFLEEPYRWVFSTGPDLWPGRIHGIVKQTEETKRTESRTSSPGQVLVALFAAETDSLPAFGRLSPLAITEVNEAGRYDLMGLPVDGQRYWLVSMLDRNGNREISGTGEFYSARPDSIRLTAAAPQLEIPVRLVNPSAPGEVRGRLTRAPGDSLAVWVQLYGADTDSLGSPRYQGRATAGGDYAIGGVAPGAYRVLAYCDVDGNGRAEAGEILVPLGTVTVRPGEPVEMPEQEGPSCGP
jgi:hypothetical protein